MGIFQNTNVTYLPCQFSGFGYTKDIPQNLYIVFVSFFGIWDIQKNLVRSFFFSFLGIWDIRHVEKSVRSRSSSVLHLIFFAYTVVITLSPPPPQALWVTYTRGWGTQRDIGTFRIFGLKKGGTQRDIFYLDFWFFGF